MRPTSAEAEWAMRAVAFDRVGEAVGELTIEAAPSRRGDPPNIRRLRVCGPGDVMAMLERGLEPIAAGNLPPLGIFARMPLATAAKGVSGRTEASASASRSSSPSEGRAAG